MNTIILDLIFSILPLFFSGLVFIFVLKKYPKFLKIPIDINLTVNNKRLFGENKNLRGFVIFGLFTPFFAYLMSYIIPLPKNMPNSILMSYFIYGLAYPFGELPNSFVKRQLNISPGKNPTNKWLGIWFKFIDNFDSLLFCGIVLFFFFNYSFISTVAAVLLGGFLHLTTDYLMIMLKLKKPQ